MEILLQPLSLIMDLFLLGFVRFFFVLFPVF